MPVSKTLAYDDDVYLSAMVYSGATAVGASGVSAKFAAFAAQQIRAALMTPNIATTAAGSQPLLFVKSGTATTTTTLTALTSAAVSPITNVLATAVSLAQGDTFWLTHGTDATASVSFALEAYVTPGAAVTCPV